MTEASWILRYLLHIAETHGGELSSAKPCQKSQQGRIIQVLHDGSEKGSFVWAEIADKTYHIPIRFTKEALAEFRLTHGVELTSERQPYCTVAQLQLSIGRIPDPSTNRMSRDSWLFLDCGFVKLGRADKSANVSNDETRSVEEHSDISLWCKGLKESGGGGNILKNRKRNSTGTSSFKPNNQVIGRRTGVQNPPGLVLSFRDKSFHEDQRAHKLKSKALPSPSISANEAPLSPRNEDLTPASSPERLISQWSPSPAKLARRTLSTSPIKSPTPAPTPSQDLDIPLPDSSLPLNMATPHRHEGHLPSRKVPPPPAPTSLQKPGTGKILVPNSDTSMLGSQSQSYQHDNWTRQTQSGILGLVDTNQTDQRQGIKRQKLPSQDETYDGDTSFMDATKRPHGGNETDEPRHPKRKSMNPLEITPHPSQEDAAGPPVNAPEPRGEPNMRAWKGPSFQKKRRRYYYAKYLNRGLITWAEGADILSKLTRNDGVM